MKIQFHRIDTNVVVGLLVREFCCSGTDVSAKVLAMYADTRTPSMEPQWLAAVLSQAMVCKRAWRGKTIDVKPEHEMEKVLFAADELTGLIWAAALMRPSKSTKDMELKSLKKKYKSKGFAAGCSREVIERGADQLGWELEKLLTMTLQAMADCEDEINAKMAE